MKLYIAGPMTGVPEYNYPLFNQVARLLRGRGYEVVNPAELDAITQDELEELDAAPPGGLGDGSALPAYLRRDFRELVWCDGIVLLPQWRSSPGANAELGVARFMGLDVYTWSDKWELVDSEALPTEGVVRETWHRFARPHFEGQRARTRLTRMMH
jgi:hypothetical protein